MPIYRVIAAVNTAPGHYNGYTPGDPLACLTARAGGSPIVFAIDAESTAMVLDEMWTLGNRARDDRQGRCWPTDVRSLSTGDVLIVYPPDHPRVAPQAFAVAPVGFARIPAPPPSAWLALEGSNATSSPAPQANVSTERGGPAREVL
jgi:hypothetical protein